MRDSDPGQTAADPEHDLAYPQAIVRSAPRIVLAKVGLDGHDRGIKVIARGLRDAGFHVIYAGIWQSPAAVAQAVVDEDADWLGISLLNGAHLSLMARVVNELRAVHRPDVGIVVGGIIPEADRPALQALGVDAVFGPGARIEDIVTRLRANPTRHRELPAETASASPADRMAFSRLLSQIARGADLTPKAEITVRPAPAPQGITVGITGSPGVGKSSLVARLLPRFRRRGKSVAVFLCDPESPVSGGALLGDRVRMSAELPDPGLWIRSLAVPSGEQGLAPGLDRMIQAASNAGFDIVLVETVGVGQGDVRIHDLVQNVIVLVQPETGDALQWEKAGLLEIADVLVINKTDLPGADRVQAEFHDHFSGQDQAPELVTVGLTDESGLDRLVNRLLKPS